MLRSLAAGRMLTRRPRSALRRPMSDGPSSFEDQVDPLVKKLEDVAVKAILVENAESLMKEQKTKVVSPYLQGLAMPARIAASTIGFYMAGYWLGFEAKIEKCQESGTEQLET